MYEIHIDDGEKKQCECCHEIYAIYNEKEMLIRNMTLVYMDKKSGYIKIKCKRCKSWIKIT